jgi:hypothetical protein
MDFKLQSEYKPTGDQPQAIEKLTEGIEIGEKYQTLLGVTGSGKPLRLPMLFKMFKDQPWFWLIIKLWRHSFLWSLKNFSGKCCGIFCELL